MAVGDIVWFDQALLDLGLKVHNLDTDTLKVGLITSAVTPSQSTSDPRWGAGGGTNLATNQVATGTAYTNGGPLLQISSGGGGSQTWTVVSSVPTLRADALTIAQDAGGFTNARWGVIYNDTAGGKQALAFIDLGSDRSIQTGSLTLDWFGANNDILTIDQV
jgi:hypothetical protein